jgi:hypothetical protein
MDYAEAKRKLAEQRERFLAELDRQAYRIMAHQVIAEMEGNSLVSPDLEHGMTEERIKELEAPVTDDQFAWLATHGRLLSGEQEAELHKDWQL